LTKIETVKKILIKHYTKYKKFPGIKFLKKKTSINDEELKKILRQLVREKFLVRYGSVYHPQKKKIKREIEKRKTAGPEIKGMSETALRVVMLFVSCVTIYLSTDYSYVWLSKYLVSWKAVLFALSMTVYTTFSLQGGLTLLRYKSLISRFIGSALLITSICALIFSMTMTVIGQYNKKTDLINTEIIARKDNKKDLSQLDLSNNQKETLLSSIGQTRNDIAIKQKLLNEFDKEELNNREYQVLSWQLTLLNRDLKNYEHELNKVNNKIEALLQNDEFVIEEAGREDFYMWFSSVSNLPANIIEFLLYLIPALFIDIMAPLGMLVAMGIYKRKEGEK